MNALTISIPNSTLINLNLFQNKFENIDFIFSLTNLQKLIISKIPDKWNSFFKQSKITCLDYKEILEKYKNNENAFIYLDPPYLDSYNSGYGKYHGKTYDDKLNIIDNTAMYIDFLELLKCKCKVLFSINANALTRYLYKDYIKEEYNKNYYQQNKDTYKIRYKNIVIKEEKELIKLITYLNKVKL